MSYPQQISHFEQISLAKRIYLAIGLALAIFILAGLSLIKPADAAGRENPFLPQTTGTEDSMIKQRDTIAQVVRDMLPEIQQGVEKGFEIKQRQAIDELHNMMLDYERNIQNHRDTGGGPVVPSGPRLPPDAKYIACVHGTALFHDSKTSQNITIPPTAENPHPCS